MPIQASNVPPHRRALAMNDEGARSEFFSDVPLPGDDGHTHEGSAEDNYSDDALPGFDGLAEATAQVFEEPAHDITDDTVDAASDDLLELAPFADDDADAPLALEEPQIQLQTTLVTEPEEAPSMTPENNQDTREAATGYNPFAAQAAAMLEPAARPFATPQMQAETAEEGQPAGYDASTDAQESLTGSLTGLSMPELVERFSRALEARSAHNDAAGKDPLVTGSNEPDLVLPSFAAKSAQPQAAPQAAPQSAPVAVDAPTAIPAARIEEAPVAAPAVPFALQPIGAEDDDSEDDDEAENADNGLTLDLNTASRRQFAQPDSAESASTDQPAEQPVMPVPFEERVAAFSASALEADDLDEDDLEDGYSSLLAMKSPISPGRDFVRIEDELGEADESDSEAEPVVVFPGQEQRPAAPAGQFFARGGSAAAATAAAPDDRPFAPPTEGRVAPSTATQPGSESEAALREALEKLQKLSGAG
ncbi:hypothetical protein N8940_00380 [Sphingomonadaceae bacterium]|nr:hypothetical protein [Sphingomonadaceae bacterium]